MDEDSSVSAAYALKQNGNRKDLSCLSYASKHRIEASFFDGLRSSFCDHYLQTVFLRRDEKYQTAAFVAEREKPLAVPSSF